jgi:hypothetical protein
MISSRNIRRQIRVSADILLDGILISREHMETFLIISS